MACNYYDIEEAPPINDAWLKCDKKTNTDTATTIIFIYDQYGSVKQTTSVKIFKKLI